MPLAGKLYRLVWGGRLFETDEWANSVHIHAPADLPDDPAAYVPAITAFHQAPSSLTSNAADLEYVKFNEIDPLTGKYASQANSFTHLLPVPVVGGSTNPGWPQISVSVGLTTVLQRGRGHAGRFYLPMGYSSPDAGGRLTAAAAMSVASNARTMINAFNAVNVDGKVVVFSKVAQTVTFVTGTRCGRVVDTQRRRRSSLDEEYQKVALV